VADLLPRIAETFEASLRDPQLPSGWRLVPQLRARAHSLPLAADLEALRVDSVVDILIVGGMRLGRASEWLVGRAPKFYVSGAARDVRLDGVRVKPHPDGLAIDANTLPAGSHLLVADSAVRRFDLVAPSLAPTLDDLCTHVRSYAIPLPRGDWTLLGADPQRVACLSVATPWQLVRALPFDPVWAVSERPGSRSIYLGAGGAPSESTAVAVDHRWSTAVLAGESNTVYAFSSGVARSARESWRRFRRVARRHGRALGSSGTGHSQ
jgi:hypothetical protein